MAAGLREPGTSVLARLLWLHHAVAEETEQIWLWAEDIECPGTASLGTKPPGARIDSVL